ncbi:CxxxxCH/CxxCH domain-containing protein [bacterium]|nr:CxxxxCH/CxxCH domain-containing protein [bacterium]
MTSCRGVILAAYNAKFVTAAFNAESRTCSNVSCHGGQETPDWQTATANAIDVPNACPSCHVSGTTRYNSYFSGKHSVHIDSDEFGVGLSAAAKCKLCHDEAKLNVSGHFDNLATHDVFEQPADDTILLNVQYIGNTCNPQAGGLTGCHKKENW